MTGRPAGKRTFSLRISRERCKGCGLCVAFCPKRVLALSKHGINRRGYSYVEAAVPEACIGCAACAIVCPDAVIEILEMEPV